MGIIVKVIYYVMSFLKFNIILRAMMGISTAQLNNIFRSQNIMRAEEFHHKQANIRHFTTSAPSSLYVLMLQFTIVISFV